MMEDGGLFGSLMGLPWSRLLPAEVEDDGKAPPPAGRAPQRMPCDVMRVPARDMHDLGRWPETDTFCTVECELCGRLMVPHALRSHMEENHVDALATLKTKLTKPRIVVKKVSQSVSPPQHHHQLQQQQQQQQQQEEIRNNETEPVTVYCSLCSAAVPAAAFRRHAIKTHGDGNSAKPLKNKTAAVKSTTTTTTATTGSPPSKKSTSKSASVSPIELTDHHQQQPVAKDVVVKKLASKKNHVVKSGGGGGEFEGVVSKKSVKKKKDKTVVVSEYDPCNHCGVVNDEGNPCLRNIVCRLHPVAMRRLVSRPFPYDVLAKNTKTTTTTTTTPQNDEERRVKIETVAETPVPVPVPVTAADEPTIITEPQLQPATPPPAKRIKTEPEGDFVVVEQAAPVVQPRPKPLICWSQSVQSSSPSLSAAAAAATAAVCVSDLTWHTALPRPLATNTFGCRIVGGLLTPCKKWDSLRKHIQTVWAQGSQDTVKTVASSKPMVVKKSPPVAAVRRKRKNSAGSTSSTGTSNSATNSTTNTPANAGVDNLLNGLLQPANGVNGVPLRLFNGNQPTFIQLNLCPSK